MFGGKDTNKENTNSEAPRKPVLTAQRTWIVRRWPVVPPSGGIEPTLQEITVQAHEISVGDTGALVFYTAWFIGDNVVQGSRRGFNDWYDYEEVVLEVEPSKLVLN